MTTSLLPVGLVVDDEPALRKVFRTSLAANGFVVEEARSGEQAVDMLPHHPFDLVLLDINMPGIGGVEACREGAWYLKVRVWMRPWRLLTPAWEYQRCCHKQFGTRGFVRSSTRGCRCFPRSDSQCFAAELYPQEPGP